MTAFVAFGFYTLSTGFYADQPTQFLQRLVLRISEGTNKYTLSYLHVANDPN